MTTSDYRQAGGYEMQRRTKSDQFKAVRVYHSQIESIRNGVAKDISKLDKELEEYLKNVIDSSDPNPGQDRG